jgi:putative addiction module component (TIGR02574 family)
MGSMGEPTSIPPGFDDLPVDEKIDYVQRLWARIARDPDNVPTPAWQIRVIDERLAALARDPDGGRSWDEVRADLRARLSQVRQ